MAESEKVESENAEEDREPIKAGSPLRWVFMVVILAAILWFGVKALREAPVAGAGNGGAPPAMSGPPPASVIVAPVEKRTAEERRRVTGSLRAQARAEVASRESGAVESIGVKEGDLVKKGDIIAGLDARRLDAELAQMEASIAAMKALVLQREAEAKRATVDLERAEYLFKEESAIPERQYLDAVREKDVTEAGIDAAKADLAATESNLELLEVRRGDLEVRAPFDGRVVRQHVEPGEWLSEGASVVTLISAGEVEAWLEVPERFSAGIEAAGTDLQIVADGNGQRAASKAIRRVADVDQRTRLFSVVVTVEDAGGSLVPGMSVYADLPVSAAQERLAVPVDAIVVTRDETYVYRASAPAEEGALPLAEKAAVTELFRRDGIAYLESESLKADDQVVVEGNERLFPGTPLMISQPVSDQPIAD